ncbi:MAG: SigB/SigF/SigG family RNA polymerase sigma factor [Bacilli bacterium]|nr:SigB/SigF/SigG family RNA polymerase sigma factor [Bacilli bacterium]
MAKYKVEISGINTNDIVVLSQEEMNELFKKMHTGDQFARDLLVEGNLKLVLSILKKFVNRFDNMDDLFQIGCIGLLKAIDNFDLSHEVKFSTYAVPMILGEVKRYVRDNTSSIRVSRSLKDLAYKTMKLNEEHHQKTGSELTTEELAEKLNVTSYEIVNALESLREPISMFEPIYNDGGDTIYLYDQIEDKSSSSNELSTKLAVTAAINELNEREQYILDERFIIGKTQMEIAKELNISQAQVSRLEKGAIKQLKKVLK